MKKIKYVLILLLLIPINVLADSVNISCSKDEIEVGNTTNCSLTGTTSTAVSSLSAKLNVTGNISVSNIKTDSIWQGNGEGGSIELYTDNNKSGTFNIATFTITGSSEGSGTITVSNISFYDASFSLIEVVNKTKGITVKKKETPAPDPTPTPTPTPDTPSTTKSGDATLKAISIDKINFKFDKNVYEYNLSVENDVESIKITAIQNDNKATITYPKTVTLKVGSNPPIKIVVKAEDGTEKTYKLNITREEKVSDESIVKDITIKNVNFIFDPKNTSYDIETDLDKLDFDIILSSDTATQEILNNENLQNGSVVEVVIKDKDKIETYYFKVVKSEKQIPDTSKEDKNDQSSNVIKSYEMLIGLVIFGIGIVSILVVILLNRKKQKK